jgi:hypothetical protein
MIPTNCAPSDTSNAPTCASRMVRAASTTGAEGDTEDIRRLIITAKGLWITDPPVAMARGIVEKDPVDSQ